MDFLKAKIETTSSRTTRTCAIYGDGRNWDPPWSRAKRWSRAIFATFVFFGIYAAVYAACPAHWAGLAAGWIPAFICAGIGYHDPLALVDLIIAFLTNF